jgi:hypothetical protein
MKKKLTFFPFSRRLYYVCELLAPRIISNVVTVNGVKEGQDSHEIIISTMLISNSAMVSVLNTTA